jgi:hypothetical protein
MNSILVSNDGLLEMECGLVVCIQPMAWAMDLMVEVQPSWAVIFCQRQLHYKKGCITFCKCTVTSHVTLHLKNVQSNFANAKWHVKLLQICQMWCNPLCSAVLTQHKAPHCKVFPTSPQRKASSGSYLKHRHPCGAHLGCWANSGSQ